MRLGDLDALSAFVGDLRSTLHKEQSTFKAMTQSEFEIKDSMLLSFQYAIDNAPTVEIPNYSGQVVPDMLRGWRYEERPQGEWITTRTMVHDGNPYCSICDEENIIRTNFCPNCGADMRGKEE